MSLKTIAIISVLSALSLSSFAQDGTTVIRTEATGQKRIMKVGTCNWSPNVDFEGKVRLGYTLPVTTCKEYRTYKAIKRGSGWNASYEPTSDATLSYKMDIEQKSFANYFNANDSYDELVIQLALLSQCNSTQSTLRMVEDSSPCQ